ncbi:hypothetical protein QCM77_42305 [Bradyrhizobium sp. SSUT18]|uniref:hypothetical protein n=1 Tax=unclassified Bradyrhizobium TaxID=2631580 RepID=UPI00244C7620|nr:MULTISPECIES: hypothetical protein [unclassified Bradyrhizobium]MDH2356649.1 hypothetical protein [Bradyrhizobium sp. SSUT112]MDH2406459.1 hypothetical protein [Bradyrhizobium sp. SSUT18]
MLIVEFAVSCAMAQVSAKPETFTGFHRNEGVNGRPETVTITDGKSFIRLTEEYRAGGYRPACETLPTRIVRRVPLRKLAPADQD